MILRDHLPPENAYKVRFPGPGISALYVRLDALV